MLMYPNLFSPMKIGGAVFRNRIIASATGHLDLRADHSFTEDFLLYYERKAMGGAAAVTIGECHVDPPVSCRGGLCVDLSTFASFAPMSRLNDSVSRHGALCSPELQHAGIYANSRGELPAYGPSECEVEGKHILAMDEAMIERTIASFANAAFLAKMAGCQMVTLHGGHGWLMQQFFSPATNKRTDMWGGTPENRSRLAVAICDAIHEKCGRDFVVEIRISATEFEDGYDPDEGILYAKALEGHADLIHVSVGVHGSLMGDSWLKFSPTMFVDDGVNVKYAAKIKEQVKNTPIVAVGALSDPAMMEEIIESGQADFVALARQLLADPDMPNKARAGKPEQIRKCVRCMSCWSNLMGGQIYCALNPETSREKESFRALPIVGEKKVLVAGGGIAGMEAALVAAKSGHHVTLCEKGGALGGAIRCEENVPFKKHLSEYIEFQERALKEAGVNVLLNTTVTAEYAEQQSFDVIIAALGTKPAVPDISGINGKNVLSALDCYKNPDLASGSIVILGGGLVGSELCVYLASLGKNVTLVEMAPTVNAGGNGTQGMVISGVLRDRHIPAHFGAKVRAISETEVVCDSAAGELRLPADCVINALGQVPLTEETLKLSSAAPVFAAIGDCLGAKNIMNAVKMGWTAARDIGRAK